MPFTAGSDGVITQSNGGVPANTKLVSENEWLVWLGCFLAASVCGTNNLWNKSGMIGLMDLSKHMKKYR